MNDLLRTNKTFVSHVLLLVLLLICEATFAALPVCPGTGLIAPDPFTLGTGVSQNAFCAAIMAGASAEQLISLNIVQTEMSAKQDQSLLTQADQLAKEVISAQQLIIQTGTLIKDLEENPLQVIVPDVNQIIANQNRINKLAQDIVNNSSQIGNNLIKDLQTPDTIGLGYGSKFQLWSDARKRAVQESTDLVTGFIKDASATDTTIWQAIKNLNAAQGRTQTAKSAGQIAAQQLTLLERMQQLLNQLVGMQAVENGAKLQADMDTAAANAAMVANPPGVNVQFSPDVYQGPGSKYTPQAF